MSTIERPSGTDVADVTWDLSHLLDGGDAAAVDDLLDEADASVQSLRATIEAAEDLVRGPQAAMDRARRTMRAAGEGLARGADRLVRGVQNRGGTKDES